jgi:hypothetical protein
MLPGELGHGGYRITVLWETSAKDFDDIVRDR